MRTTGPTNICDRVGFSPLPPPERSPISGEKRLVSESGQVLEEEEEDDLQVGFQVIFILPLKLCGSSHFSDIPTL